MHNDKMLMIDVYKDYGIKNVTPFCNHFEKPVFIETDRKKLMREYSREYVHLRCLKTGMIMQFRLSDRMPRYIRRKGILVTTTLGDTAYAFSNQNPSFQRTIAQYQYCGRRKTHEKAITGYIQFGGYVVRGIETFLEHLEEADVVITDSQLLAIFEDLKQRRDYYESQRVAGC